ELEARGCTGSPVTVVGGANSAGQAALYLAGRGSQVSLVVRGPDIATEMSAYLVGRLLAHPRVTGRCRSEVTRGGGGVRERGPPGGRRRLPRESQHPRPDAALPPRSALRGFVLLHRRRTRHG